jgi:uncharacterized low-complexity protein
MNSTKTLFAAAALASIVVVPVVNAAGNPFSNTELASGFNLHDPAGDHGGEGKCGEGKCGEGKDKGDKGEKTDAPPAH